MRSPKDVTDAELSVLQALWDESPTSTRELAGRLYPDESDATAYATVQKLLRRLSEKGFVQALEGKSPRLYRASVDRDGLIERRLRSVADQLCEGSFAPPDLEPGAEDEGALSGGSQRALAPPRRGGSLMFGLADLAANAVLALPLVLAAYFVGRSRRHPALTHALCLLALLKLLTPPLFDLPLLPAKDLATPKELRSEELSAAAAPRPTPERREAPEASGPAFALSVGVEKANDASATSFWLPSLGWFWAAGSVVVLLELLRRARSFRRLLRERRPAPRSLRRRSLVLGRRLGLRRLPKIEILPYNLTPMLVGAGPKTSLFLPEPLLERIDGEQLDALLLHELAHYRRRDHWVRWIELAGTTLHWWNPIFWLARKGLRQAEEECCDAWVVSRMPGRGARYAAALLTCVDLLAESKSRTPLGASAMAGVGPLKRRVEMIIDERAPARLGRASRLAILGLALAVLPWLPIRAQERKHDEPTKNLETVQRLIDKLEAAGLDEEARELRGVAGYLKKQVPSDRKMRDRELMALEQELQDIEARTAAMQEHMAALQDRRSQIRNEIAVQSERTRELEEMLLQTDDELQILNAGLSEVRDVRAQLRVGISDQRRRGTVNVDVASQRLQRLMNELMQIIDREKNEDAKRHLEQVEEALHHLSQKKKARPDAQSHHEILDVVLQAGLDFLDAHHAERKDDANERRLQIGLDETNNRAELEKRDARETLHNELESIELRREQFLNQIARIQESIARTNADHEALQASLATAQAKVDSLTKKGEHASAKQAKEEVNGLRKLEVGFRPVAADQRNRHKVLLKQLQELEWHRAKLMQNHFKLYPEQGRSGK